MKIEKTLSSYFQIGQRIQKKREQAKITQRDLANKIQVSFRTIQNYEANLVNPKIEVLKDISKYLNCDLEYLIFGMNKSEIIGTQYLQFASMYRNLEELSDINDLISNINHDIDNIKDKRLRKKAIKLFESTLYRIRDFLKFIESEENKSTHVNEKKIDKYALQTEILQVQVEIERIHVYLANLYNELNKLQSKRNELEKEE